MQARFLDIGKQPGLRTPFAPGCARPKIDKTGRGKDFASGFVIVQRDSELPEVIRALRPPSRLARCLDGGQQKRDENANNGDYYQQFNKCKTEGSKWLRTHHSQDSFFRRLVRLNSDCLLL